MLIFKNRFDKISKSIVAKNEMEEMEKSTNIRKQLIDTIETQVKASVATIMPIANRMKERGEGLSDEEGLMLKEKAKNLTLNTFPPSLTQEGGVLLEIIGGRERLDSIIDSLIEKHVFEYKGSPTPQIVQSSNVVENNNTRPTRQYKNNVMATHSDNSVG